MLRDEKKVSESPSTGEVVSQVSERVAQLMRDELELAKAGAANRREPSWTNRYR